MRIFTFLLFPALCWKLSMASSEFATVEVSRFSQRSATGASYQVNVNGPEQKLRLNLRSPSNSIFTPDFQYMVAATNPLTGKVEITNATPEKRELARIEANFFTDSESNAAVSLKRSAGGYEMNGRINDMSIIHREAKIHEVRQTGEQPGNGNSDYIQINRTIPKSNKNSKSTTRATPEVFIVWDHENTKLQGYNRAKILDYLGVFFHAINNRYATASNPAISFKISGVLTINSTASQPYMENNKVDGGYDIDPTLSDFAKWAFQNSGRNPKFDVAALISGTDMKMKDSSGRYSSGVAGLAYMGGACYKPSSLGKDWGTSVSEDIGGYYRGVWTVAHELAHNLGSPHDGDENAEDCPWSDGYIMSYEGWGTRNKFYFSSCTLRLMKNLIDSSAGACLRTQDSNSEVPLSSDNVGDRFSMKDQCIKATNNKDAIVDPNTSANDLCKNLKCRYPDANNKNRWWIKTLNQPAGDNAECGNGGRCRNGECV